LENKADTGEDSTSSSWCRKASFEAFLEGWRSRKNCFLLLQLALILFCSCQPCLSQPSETSPADQGHRPFPVYLSIYVINVGRLDVEAGTFTADFYLKLRSDRQYSLNSLEFMNGFPSVVEQLEDTPTLKDYRIQATLSTAIDLRNFPFDQQVLPIII
jgi:hypothetical protein